jgi:formylglycine-generating enzyme required for sulfatase activity
VTITRPFYIGIYPVTQAHFERIIGRNPAHFNKAHGGGPDHPVEQVSWEDAVTFCEKLTELSAESEHARLYRLPTEAEWEYACRAGTMTAYSFGPTVGLKQVHFFGLDATVWAQAAAAAGKSEKVGNHAANGWGLFDMHGNVLEWCTDWFSENWYRESPDSDPMGPKHGWQRVARGGSFSQFVTDCRSAARLGRAPGSRLNTLGFRVAMSIPGA